jgi:two-component system, sensor histidine kinase and response regulator
VDTARAGPSGSLHRDGIVEAIAFAAERFLASTDWREAADDVLARLGQAADVSRAYVATNTHDGQGRLTSSWLAEWTQEDVLRVMDDPDFRSAPWEESGFGRWARILASGEAVQGAVAAFPESERMPLELHGVVSLVKFPVFVGDEWWGAIGFDDCVRRRDWSEEELAALRASATLLGAAVQRQLDAGRVAQAEDRYRASSERPPAVMYVDVLDEGGLRIESIGTQVEALLGYPHERFTNDPTFWRSILHPDDRARVEASSTEPSERGSGFELEYRVIAADGAVVWIYDISRDVPPGPSARRRWEGYLVDITSRRLAEEQLTKSEERYRQMVDFSPDAILVHTDGHFVYANAAAAQLLMAKTPSALVGLPIGDIVHPDFRHLAAERAAKEVGGQAAPLLEEIFIRLDGREIVVEVAGIPVEYEGRRSGQIVVRDISRRKEVEERLRAAEERYRIVVEHIPAVVYVEALAGDPERFYISPQVEAIFGYTPDEWRLTPNFWLDHVHPEDRPGVVEHDEQMNIERERFSYDYRLRAADGGWRWVHDEATFLEQPDGDGFWQGFILDITDRKRVEDRLREAELKFRSIVEQNEAIFYTQQIDPIDRTISSTAYVAPGSTDLIGYPIEEIEADPTLWGRIIHEDDRERVRSANATSHAEASDHFSVDYRVVRKDGTVVWVHDSAALVTLPDQPPYWQGLLLDVTEAKLAEEQLARALDAERDAAQRLRALDDMKNTFLQAVSHDLRTPLAAILGLAVTLEREDIDMEAGEAQDLAARIAKNARKLDRLVADLLDMDRLAQGIVSPKLEYVDVGDVVRRTVADSEAVDRERLSTDIRRVLIPVDASKVERIVENLLANTARHTPSNAHVWVSVREHETGALIKVEDSGVGVPADLRESIFEPFQQGPDAPQHSPGVGVGLTLVRRFAELHGGRAWIEERVGGGSSFQVFLPGRDRAGVDA